LQPIGTQAASLPQRLSGLYHGLIEGEPCDGYQALPAVLKSLETLDPGVVRTVVHMAQVLEVRADGDDKTVAGQLKAQVLEWASQGRVLMQGQFPAEASIDLARVTEDGTVQFGAPRARKSWRTCWIPATRLPAT
jgi:hypothetical protein